MKRKPEQWKTIKDYPNYMISSWGRVWSKSRSTKYFNSRYGHYATLHYKGHILKPYVMWEGYLMVELFNKNRKRRHCKLVHRLVARAFISNPNHYPYVNHIDECKSNNYVGNLEWCTQKYNVNYSHHLHPAKWRNHSYKFAHSQREPVILFHTLFDAYYFSSYREAYYFITGVWNIHQSLSVDIKRGDKFHGWNILPFK